MIEAKKAEPPALIDDSVAPPSGPKPPRPPVAAEVAPAASPRLAELPAAEKLRGKIDSYFNGHVGRRIHIQTDKPLYKPGETIWVRVWDLTTRAFSGAHKSNGMYVELVSPRGASVAKKKVHEQAGAGQIDFPLLAGMQGGEYTLRIKTLDGQKSERPVVVSSYEAPRLKLKLEFVRKAYGAGDEVNATIEVKRPTGEALKNHPIVAAIRLDGQDLPRVPLTTDENGEGLVRFTLPQEIALGDGLLTVLCDEGGLTESIARRVPIVLKKMSFASYPEGGDLVIGLPGRIYFEAKNPLGKPADVSGHVSDDTGTVVARFESVRDGLGRFDFSPQPGHQYHVEIDKPVGITEHYALPPASAEGCVLRSFDDLDGQLHATRVSVRCTQPRTVHLTATLRENLFDAATVAVPVGAPAIAYLEPRGQGSEATSSLQGVARVTLYDDAMKPLAERLIYRQRRARLGIKVTSDKKTYVPRDRVQLDLLTTDAKGNPVPADLAVGVVDDTVLSFADDKTGHMLSRLYLEPELPGKIEEPNFYFDLSEEKSAMAMELMMGTRGYRRFEWLPGLAPARPNRYVATRSTGVAPPALPKAPPKAAGKMANARPTDDAFDEVPVEKPAKKMERRVKDAEAAPMLAVREEEAQKRPEPERKAKKEAAENKMDMKPAARPMAGPQAPPPPAAAPMATVPATPPMEQPRAPAADKPMPMGNRAMAMAKAEKAKDDMDGLLDRDAAKAPKQIAMQEPRMNGGGAARGRGNMALGDDDMGGVGDLGAMRRPVLVAVKRRPPPEAWAPVRVFPAPTYEPGFTGTRNDFRETIAWQPSVQTGQDGKATVSFFLSDGVTSFRVVTEGAGSGAAGREETVLKSSLPFSLAVKLPLEVSEGDHIKLPLVLSNEQSLPLQVKLEAQFGNLVALDRPVARTSGELSARARDTLYYPLTVTGKKGQNEIHFIAEAGGLRDEVTRSLRVSPRGFPQHLSRSGRLRENAGHDLELAAALPDTADGELRVYPSLLSNMVASLEGMLQHPVGCFEQASSANYPNIMILRALRDDGIRDPRLTGRASRLLDEGYKRLIGYETPQKGYEWFGSVPGHEALTAYGLLQFSDMRVVYHDVDRQMLSRNADWLLGRRDGKGGFLRDAKSLDSFGAASKAVTDAYITYSLSEIKQAGIEAEIDSAAYLAQNTNDAYLLALSTSSLLNSGRRGAGQAAARRLVGMQDGDGSWKKADHSITRSGGENLIMETTALSIMALLKSGGHEAPVDKGVEWVMSHRRGSGAFGSTQATVLGLRALVAYMGSQARDHVGGSVMLTVNGRPVVTKTYDAASREPIVIRGLAPYLKAGPNRVELRHSGHLALPYSLSVDYRSLQPATSPQATIDLSTTLERTQMKLGESVRMVVTLTNKTDRGQPMTMARVQLPGGLTFQNWQLKELREKGLIGFYETQPREVILYLRDMKPRQKLDVPLDLVAIAAGEYTAQASTAYLYYTDEHKTWVTGTQVSVEP